MTFFDDILGNREATLPNKSNPNPDLSDLQMCKGSTEASEHSGTASGHSYSMDSVLESCMMDRLDEDDDDLDESDAMHDEDHQNMTSPDMPSLESARHSERVSPGAASKLHPYAADEHALGNHPLSAMNYLQNEGVNLINRDKVNDNFSYHYNSTSSSRHQERPLDLASVYVVPGQEQVELLGNPHVDSDDDDDDEEITVS